MVQLRWYQKNNHKCIKNDTFAPIKFSKIRNITWSEKSIGNTGVDTTFAFLFSAASKNNYTTSVTYFLSILKKYPNLEQKLQHCASINLTRKDHYSTFDEVFTGQIEKNRTDSDFCSFNQCLEVREVGYIKQNIIGNLINQENLQLQIKSAQEEKEKIDTLLNEFLDPYTFDKKNRKINNRIDPLWKLIKNLIEIFQMDNYMEHELFKKNPPTLYIRHIEVIKFKKKSPRKRKEPEKNNESTTHSISHQLITEFPSTENINKQSNILDNENCTSK
ncbi:hypothetical protein Glove_341g73 [Diversispora epigaea]|uniref:Uncharacterized protein n=1 Tax=Diversispora epigaea TaxID=1348612 RepID=A0A397HH66_9GLOM|nr:hypothetical protein Glove_341g73 [Diversispora epigaea]